MLDALKPLGYSEPTPIQAEAIPVVINGQDVLGCAQTGTGKTAAFSLPMLEMPMPPSQHTYDPFLPCEIPTAVSPTLPLRY